MEGKQGGDWGEGREEREREGGEPVLDGVEEERVFPRSSEGAAASQSEGEVDGRGVLGVETGKQDGGDGVEDRVGGWGGVEGDGVGGWDQAGVWGESGIGLDEVGFPI